jgi:hypothetical protein
MQLNLFYLGIRKFYVFLVVRCLNPGLSAKFVFTIPGEDTHFVMVFDIPQAGHGKLVMSFSSTRNSTTIPQFLHW